MCSNVWSTCMPRCTQRHRAPALKKWGFISLSSYLTECTELHPLLFVSCDMTVWLRRTWPDKSGEESPFFDHRYGTPKGQAGGPEKPAAWHYYFQLGSDVWVTVESPPLCSPPPPPHLNTLIPTDNTHTQRHLCSCYTLLSCVFLSVSSVCTCRTVTCRDCQSWTMPPSVIWGRGLSCSGSRLEAEVTEERVRGKKW